MYERMLDKQHTPSFEEFAQHCGERRELLESINDYLTDKLYAESILRFPYGNSYGWGIKYSIKSKHICDLFAETDAFTVMLRLTNVQYARAYDCLTDYGRELIDNKYPCGEGGWIHYRVLTEQQAEDVKRLLSIKVGKQSDSAILVR